VEQLALVADQVPEFKQLLIQMANDGFGEFMARTEKLLKGSALKPADSWTPPPLAHDADGATALASIRRQLPDHRSGVWWPR
jgi:hypothetical protein